MSGMLSRPKSPPPAPSASESAAPRLKTDQDLCCFCQAAPAAVTVIRNSNNKNKKNKTSSYCLLHYYSTSAVRESSSAAKTTTTTTNQQAAAAQLPAMQSLFAQAFTDLQQQLSEEAARAYDREHDPLAIVSELQHNNNKRTQRAPKPKRKLAAVENGGGFLRHTPLPERLRRTQQKQLQQQEAWTNRMQRAAAATATSNNSSARKNSGAAASYKKPPHHQDLSQRRKPTRQSVWNVALDRSNPKQTKPKQQNITDEQTITNPHDFQCSSCGSGRVHELSSSSANNHSQESMTKGEVWGTDKDRADEIRAKCQCLDCGKVWHEEL